MLLISSLGAADLVSAGVRAGIVRESPFAGTSGLAPHLEGRRASYLEGVHHPVTFRLADVVMDIDLTLEQFRATGEMTAVIERYR